MNEQPDSERGRVLLAGGEGDAALEAVALLLAEGGYEIEREPQLAALAERPATARLDALVVALVASDPPALDLLKRLREQPAWLHVPAIVVGPPDLLDNPAVALAMTEIHPLPVHVQRLAGRVRSNVEVKRLIDHGERKSEKLASLLEISRALNSTLDSGAILYIIARKIAEAMELVRCSFIVPDLTHGVGHVIACKDDPNIHALEINLNNYPEIIQVLRTGRRVVIADVETDPIMAGIRKFADLFLDQSIMTLPLEFHREIIGVLQIRKKGQKRGFTGREIEYCELLANAAAAALKNAQLYEDVESHNYELRRQKRELEQLSEELQRKNQELIRLQQLKEDFTTMIVHDLRSPLMIVQGVFDILHYKHGTNADERELIEDGTGVTKRILALINNLLDVSRIEGGELRLQVEEIDLGALVREAAEPYRLLAHSRGIELVAEIGETLPSVRADRRCLGQVLDNLLGNAFKFTPDGGRVEVRVEAAAGGENPVHITVQDSGAGIAAEDLPNIFKKFRQGRSGARSGTGLGLTIVDLLVTAHGGRVAVETELGKGSCFRVQLPVRTPSGADHAPVLA